MSEYAVEVLTRRFDRLFNSVERRNAESIWLDLATYLLPVQATGTEGNMNPGAQKSPHLKNSTGVQAAFDLAATIHSTLTNPATKWSRYRFSDKTVRDPDADHWLEDTTTRIHNAYVESNFSNEVSRAYSMYPTLGTMVLMHDEKPPGPSGEFRGFVFKAWSLFEVACAESLYGFVDTIVFRFKLTARQAFQRWGKELPETITRAYVEDPEKEFEFYHGIFPRPDKDIKINTTGHAAGKNRPYASVYIARKDQQIVEEDGYYEFPAYVVRWATSPGELYGYGPGHIAIHDVKTLNKVIEMTLKSYAYAIGPMILAEQKAVFSSLDRRPFSVSIVKDISRIKTLESGARLDLANFEIEQLKNDIKHTFFLDKLFLPDRKETGEMTAYEIATRTQQLQQVIGPTLGRLDTEFLNPLSKRSFNMMLRGNALLPRPASLSEGGDINVEYVNALARAQKIEDVTALNQWTQDLTMLAQLNGEVVDNLNVDTAARIIAERRGVPLTAIQDEKVMQKIRQQRAQQQQQAMALEAGVQKADMKAQMRGTS